jgi:hypothetical protein
MPLQMNKTSWFTNRHVKVLKGAMQFLKKKLNNFEGYDLKNKIQIEQLHAN